jgi:peptidyl-prolyl cis-trans isomerase A (cyclophilin A)
MPIELTQALRRIAKLSGFAGAIFAAGIAFAAEDAAPKVSFQTSLGEIIFELDREHAPATVANFLNYVNEGHFDGTVFYRVVPGFVIEAGSLDAAGKGRGVHEPIPLESANAQSNARGTITMAHGDEPDSATAEFFINLVDNKGLDRMPDDHDNKTGYAAFGRVIEGMDVVDSIAKVPLNGGYGPFGDAAPAMPVTIVKVTIQN